MAVVHYRVMKIPPTPSHHGSMICLLKVADTKVANFYDCIKEVLHKGGEQPSTATGTWPFLGLDMMKAWLLGQELLIQSWHDLEIVFMSFTALYMWFQSPFYPKSVHLDSNLTWIFIAHKKGIKVIRDWERPIVFDYTVHGHDAACADTQGEIKTGFRIQHVHNYVAELPKDWTKFHALVDENSIFCPLPKMDMFVMPVVLDGSNSFNARYQEAVFHQVSHISPDPSITTISSSASGSLSTMGSCSTKKQFLA
ncbi:hypothetical protein EDD22DRAFT_849610 [Suillus occidentalis]|nr:hypothetical protein EDD22DRAFT_849610 [Suillus occidentalis]